MNRVELGGRAFQVIANGPIKHDYWMLAQVRAAGIDQVTMGPDESPAAFVDALLAQLMASGQSLVILGGMLAPADLALRDWTPAVAAETTAWIETLITPEDKQLVHGLVARVLVGFFQSGLAAVMISRTASRAERIVAGEPEAPPLLSR